MSKNFYIYNIRIYLSNVSIKFEKFNLNSIKIFVGNLEICAVPEFLRSRKTAYEDNIKNKIAL